MRVRVIIDAMAGRELEIATAGDRVKLAILRRNVATAELHGLATIELPLEQARRVREVLGEAIAEAEREATPTRPTPTQPK